MSISLNSFGQNLRVAVIGASGGIGRAFVDHLAQSDQVACVYALSRAGIDFDSDKVQSLSIDLEKEETIAHAAEDIKQDGELDIVIVAVGILHDGYKIQPEKALKQLDSQSFARVLAINTIGPAMAAKHFVPLLPRDRKSVFAALSARVGSISDNGMGGWHSYRASKAALNMIIKNVAIETGRRYKQAAIIGLHPGTVDTGLSEPFQSNVPDKKLFTPAYSAECLLKVINDVAPEQSGALFGWDGEEIAP